MTNPEQITKSADSELVLTQILQELFPTEQLPPQELLTKLIDQRNALEMALFDKRLENLKQFSHYQTRIKTLQEIELSELAKLRKENDLLMRRIERNEFNHKLSLDTNWPMLLFILTTLLILLK